jgi:hypothetical protein
MRRNNVVRLGLFSMCSFVFAVQLAHADVVTDWNQKALALMPKEGLAGGYQTRALAMLHVAMFDAVNSIENRYMPYKAKYAVAPATSKEAAAASAAYTVLVRIFPKQQEVLRKDYDVALAAVPEGQAKTEGITLGEKVAADILAMRADDGSAVAEVYQPHTTAGVYVPTTIPIFSTWGAVKPWSMKKGSQVRPDAPPALSSAVWTKDFNEVKELGWKNSAKRTAEQTDVGRFWLFTGPGTYNPIAVQLSAANNLSIIESARAFALLAIASADAHIAIFDAKYTYNFWRPITAIRNAEMSHNPATVAQAGWSPLADTPMHPEYPCAHCVASTTAGEVLKAVFGAGEIPPVSLTSTTAPGVTRRFTRLDDYIAEVSNARIWAGFHYRNSTMVGEQMGRSLAQYTVQNYLQPVSVSVGK